MRSDLEPTQAEHWSSAHMEHQLQYLAIPLLEARWPGYQDTLLSGNVTNHTAFVPDALRVTNMKPSSEDNQNDSMRDSWNPMYTWIRRR